MSGTLAGLRLRIVTPTQVVVDLDDVAGLRAEDATGRFGIRPGHADFLTALVESVIDWTRADGTHGCCAVGRGVLNVQGGREVGVAAREAQLGTDLGALAQEVERGAQAREGAERAARLQAAQLHVQAVRRLVRLLRPEGDAP